MVNLSEWRTALSGFINDYNTDASSRYPLEYRDMCLNIKYKEIIALLPEWVLITRTTVPLVIGQNYVTRPSNMGKILGVFYGTETRSQKLGSLTEKEYSYLDLELVYGTPTQYCVSGTRIYLDRIVDSAQNLIIKNVQSPSDLSDGSPTPITLPDNDWQYLPALGAAALMLMSNRGGDLTNAQYYDNTYARGLEVVKKKYHRPTDDRTIQIKDYSNGIQPFDNNGYI